MATSDATRPARRARPPLPPGFGTIWSTVALDLVGFGIVLPILPLYAERFGASPTEVGLLLASFSIAQLLFSPIWGRVSDRIGRKPVLVVSLFGTAIGSFLTGAAGTLWLVFAGRLIDGASGASVSVAQAAVTDLAPPGQRPRLLGLLGAAFGIGFVAGPAIGALAALAGPELPFYLAGVLSLANALAAIRRLPETSRVGGHPTARPIARQWRAPRGALVRFAAIGFVSLTAFSGFEATFALLGDRRFDLTETGTGAVFACVGIVLVVVQGGLIHPITQRYGSGRVLQAGLASVAVGLVLLATADGWTLLAVALLFLVLGQGISTPTLTTLVADHSDPERRGSALGFQQSAGGLARVVGPALAGGLFDHVSIAAPYLCGAGLVAVALALAAGEV